MRYFLSSNKYPLIHISSGELQNKDKFIHPRRNLDSFVIIFCTKGSIYFVQKGNKFILKPNQYLILFSNEEHYGFRESEGDLSYYWCHFHVKDNDFKIISEREKSKLFPSGDYGKIIENYSHYYFLPETGSVSSNNRSILIFRQLLDLARRNCYSKNLTNYALSLLAMEITQEEIDQKYYHDTGKKINSNMEKIIEWIRTNFNQKLSAKKIAGLFDYSADYLSTCFKKYRGISLMKHISLVRTEKAKELLLNTNKSIKEIAYDSGFFDEKVFLKRFKQLTGATPTKYRNAFCLKRIVK